MFLLLDNWVYIIIYLLSQNIIEEYCWTEFGNNNLALAGCLDLLSLHAIY